MRVLIVDDEIKVCQLILHLVDWPAYEMEVIGVINDGKEAYQTISREKPDIVITDIRMPGMDGIDLVKNALKVKRDIYFVIISGYSQFEYARQAVSLGVEDYLVKPIKKKELQAVLDKIRDKNRENNMEQEERTSLKVKLVESREKIKNSFLQYLLTQPEIYDNGDLIENQYQLNFGDGENRLLLVRFYENLFEPYNEEQHFAVKKIEKLFREKLKNICCECLSFIYGHEILFFLNDISSSGEGLTQQLKICGINCSVIREIFPRAEISTGVGRSVASLEECRESLRNIRQVMLDHYLNEKTMVFWEEKLLFSRKRVNDIITPPFRKKLLTAIEVISTEALAEIFELLKVRMIKEADSGALAEKCIRELVHIFLLGARNYESLMEIPAMSYYMEGCGCFYAVSDMLEWLRTEFTGIMEAYRDQCKNTDTRSVRQAKQFIQKHFAEQINLEVVSSQIGLNPAYFSNMFKKATGQNFMNYLTEVRVENAKMLLTQSERELADIVEDVGYSDPKYFSKVFKRSVGLTPAEFRRLYN